MVGAEKESPVAQALSPQLVGKDSWDKIWKLLALAAGTLVGDFRRAVEENRATVWMVNGTGGVGDGGFACLAKTDESLTGDLVVMAAAGRWLVKKSSTALLFALAKQEGCWRVVCNVADVRLARKLSGIGWKVHRWGGEWRAELDCMRSLCGR